MFFSVAEPVYDYVKPPAGPARTNDAAREAVTWTIFHYGVTGWAMYALMGGALAYFAFRRNLPLTIRAVLYPIAGKRINGRWGDAIDAAAVLGTIFGIATSLGIGVVQLNYGLHEMFGVHLGRAAQIGLIGLSVGITTISATTGADKGIRRLSELNVVIAIALLIYILVAGRTDFLLNGIAQNAGDYISTFLDRTLNTFAWDRNPETINQPAAWLGSWTMFFWAWWVAWAPFAGLFLARISRERTLCQFIFGVLVVPFSFIVLWISIFGNSALGSNSPGAPLLLGIATFTGLLFYVTSADSGSLVMGNFTSKLPDPMDDCATGTRIFWSAAIMELLEFALLDACEAVGIPRAEFNSGTTVLNGANFFQINSRADGTRSSSSVSYLHPILDRPNLTIRTGSWARRIIIEGCRAVRVEITDNAFGRGTRISAGREIIVSTGAIDSPKLLMLSGIGPADHLRENGIDVLVDSPGVGAHLQDHPEGVIGFEAAQRMVRSSTQWWEIGIFTPTVDGLDRPNLMMHYGSVPFDMHTLRQGYPTADETFCLTPNVTHARSRGTVRLRSRDFRDEPRVDPRYFTDPGGHDLRVMIGGIRKARKIASAAPLSDWVARELYPGRQTQSDAELADYIRRTHNTVYHPAGTVRMGAPGDPMSPLDPQLRVKGVDGLRVADASTFPAHTTVNPNITVMLVGERCAELVAGAQ